VHGLGQSGLSFVLEFQAQIHCWFVLQISLIALFFLIYFFNMFTQEEEERDKDSN
jgi:hypothetical protein